jgi:hypothetical protein
MGSFSKRIRNAWSKLKPSNTPTGLFDEVRPSPHYPLDRNDGLNIRLNKVDNGWVVNATTEDKQGNYLIQTRVCLSDTDVMDVVNQIVSLYKIK